MLYVMSGGCSIGVTVIVTSLVARGHLVAIDTCMPSWGAHGSTYGSLPSSIMEINVALQIVLSLNLNFSLDKVTPTLFSNESLCDFVLGRMKTQQYKIGATCT